MSSKGEKGGKPYSIIILNTVSILIVVFTLFIVIWRTLLWEILNPLMIANIYRLMALFKIPNLEIVIEWTPIVRLMSQFVIAAVIVVLGIRSRYVRRKEFWLMSIPLLAILIISIGSQFWSLNAANTVKRSWFLLAATMGGIYIGLEFYRSRIVLVFEILSILFVLLSYAIVFIYPVHGIMTFDAPGAWRGLFDYKSFAGEMIAFAGVMFLFRFANYKKASWIIRLYSIVLLSLSLFFLVKTQNKTAMGVFIIIATILVLGILFIKWGGLLKPIHWWILGAVGAAALLTFWFGKNTILGLLGVDASLTGRVPIWITLIPFIKQRLLFGFGFGEVFWYSHYLEEFWKVAPWKAGLAHSGYVESIVDTGVVGFFIWIVFLIEVGYLALRHFFTERTLYALIFFAWFVQVILNNVTENLLGTYEAFYYLLLVISFAYAFREQLDRKQPSVISVSSTAHSQRVQSS
jgi:exopolysaccharide production protein ExoQ